MTAAITCAAAMTSILAVAIPAMLSVVARVGLEDTAALGDSQTPDTGARV